MAHNREKNSCSLQIKLAGHKFFYRPRYAETNRLFLDWAQKADSSDEAALSCGGSAAGDCISVSEERMKLARSLSNRFMSDSAVEFRALIGLTSKSLLRYRACIFHSVSFIYRGKAWLLTAESGGGKTTQYRNWQKLFPGEITMICGDMPVLACNNENSITVYPSPWNGKEGIGTRISAPLGGVITLKKASENFFEKLTPSDAFREAFDSFVVMPDTEEEITSLFGLVNTVFVNYPVWRFSNLGNDASTEMLRALISREST